MNMMRALNLNQSNKSQIIEPAGLPLCLTHADPLAGSFLICETSVPGVFAGITINGIIAIG